MEPTLDRVRRARLDRSLNTILLMVGLQFLLGMWLILYGRFPSGNSTFVGAITDGSDPVLIAHIVVGTILIGGALGIVAQSLRDPYRPLRWFAIAGIAAVVVAWLSGEGFVASGYSSNPASFAMAVGLLATVTVYYEALVALRSHPLTPVPVPPPA